MKKIIAILLIAMAIAGISCKTTATTAPAAEVETAKSPEVKRPEIVGEVTQDKIDDALSQIYDSYRSRLDLSGAGNYVVVKGDTLSQITRNSYGKLKNVGEAGTSNGFYFPVIMMASDSDIVDPDLIEPGMKLVVPDLEKNLNNPVSRKAIKECLIDVSYVYNKKGAAATEKGLIKLADSL